MAQWEGAVVPRNGRVVNARSRWSREPDAIATDYDAACDVGELLGIIPVSTGAALVLGDEVPMSTWVPSPLFSGGLIVVPMTWPHPGMTEEPLLATVRSVDRSAFASNGLTLPRSSGRFILCAACDAGPNWIYATARIAVPSNQYEVRSAEVCKAGFWLRLHALDETYAR